MTNTNGFMKERFDKENIIKMFQENQTVIDNHNDESITLTGLVEFKNPTRPLAGCMDARYYSLNEIYIESADKKLHLSQCSVGGVLWGAYPDEKQLKKYNDDTIQDGGKIVCIHLADGTKVYPEGEQPEENKSQNNTGIKRNPKDKYLLHIKINGITSKVSVHKFEINNGVLTYEMFVNNAKEHYDTFFTHIPLCKIDEIKSGEYAMLDRVAKYTTE